MTAKPAAARASEPCAKGAAAGSELRSPHAPPERVPKRAKHESKLPHAPVRPAEQLLLCELVPVEHGAPLAPADLEEIRQLGADLIGAPGELAAGELRRGARTVEAAAGAHREPAAPAQILDPPPHLVPDAVDPLGGEDALLAAEDEAQLRVVVAQAQHVLGPRAVPVHDPGHDRRRDTVASRQLRDIRDRLSARERLEVRAGGGGGPRQAPPAPVGGPPRPR